MKTIVKSSIAVRRHGSNGVTHRLRGPLTEEQQIIAQIKALGGHPMTRAEKARMKRFCLLGMPAE